MNRTLSSSWESGFTIMALPLAALTASALTLTLVAAPELGPEVLAAVLVARLALGVARWLYVMLLGRQNLAIGIQRLQGSAAVA